ncbi:MAG: archease [Candidatus Omnitrophica bacterium]|nr:archease [Candidatus Omnitrophota bacterium]
MMKKNYEFLEHTADIGIRVKAKDLKALFKNIALAMFDVMAKRNSDLSPQSSKLKKIIIKQRAGSLEELLVNWLNELLSLSAVKESIFTDFNITKLDNDNLEAEVFGEDIKNYKLNTEIKAATYHQLKIEEKDTGWQAEIIFDV